MSLFKVLGIPKIGVYVRDWRFWLLLWIVNISGNMGFTYYVSEPMSVIVIFLITFSYMLFTRQYYARLIIYSLSFWFILFLQSLYVEHYSVTTTLHYVLQIGIAVSIVVLFKEKILSYFPAIIFIYCLISLVCFAYNLTGGIVPYVHIDETAIDGGRIMRVYNPFYTQLTAPGELSLLNVRNCGPFWEPGAFQGYINLAFFLDMLSGNNEGSRKRYLVYIITIVSTMSTGGFIALFVNLLYLVVFGQISFSKPLRLIVVSALLFASFYLYSSLNILGSKISVNEDRLLFSLESAKGSYLWFGYGYDISSFSTSSMKSASSIYSLFRYVGIVGFSVFISYLVFNNCPKRFLYAAILFLILMNEPFLQFGFWWATPLFIFANDKN